MNATITVTVSGNADNTKLIEATKEFIRKVRKGK